MLRARTSNRRQAHVAHPSHFSEGYTDWFERFKRILLAYNHGLIREHELQKYQLFLLEHGQFNASFTFEELNRLHYPRSPFAIMHRHTYLRSTDNWATEILRINYKRAHGEKLFPIFLHSNLFWNELNRYCCVFKSNEITNQAFINTINTASLNSGELTNPIWIQLVNDHSIDFKKSTGSNIKKCFFRKIAADNAIPENLIPLFETIMLGNTTDIQNRFTGSAILNSLEGVFPQIQNEAQRSFDHLYAQFNEPGDLTQCDQNWFNNIFGMARKYTVAFPAVNINNPNALKQYAIVRDNRARFLEFLAQVRGALTFERPHAGEYVEVINKWIKDSVAQKYQTLSKQIVYFYQDNFQDIETMVFCDCSGVPEFVNSVMGNLGYRIDPVQAARAVLRDSPLLFVNAEETGRFWDLFVTIPMVDKLPELEKMKILDLKDRLTQEIIQTENAPVAIHLPSFDEEWQILNIMECHPPFALYFEYIKNYLANYREYNSENRAFEAVANPEIKLSLRIFFQACRDRNLPLAIRCVQVLSEVMLLDLENQPLDTLLPGIIRENHLREFPVQAVLMIPYAMRAFVRVFQVLDTEYSQRTPNVFVTNQSYFEWLSNLDRLDTRRYSVTPIRHTSEIIDNADIIFVEIHPNNAVETRQFAHDLKNLINRMHERRWQTKGRTLVIDVTLNALDDEEIQNILQRAKHLVDSGWLNIILIQSLTKFSQLGLDKRSAGILTVINNGQSYWQAINHKLAELNQIEPVDSSTINFFSYFFTLNRLTKQYIAQINRNVRFVYTHIIEQFNDLEILSRNRFQITMSSDPRACYVALNMRGLLPDIDSGFSLGTHDIEVFSEDLLLYFIHPLCEFLGLSLTERMSIGFPLCSVNAMLASMRFTIGLEPDEQLLKYADILAYTAFALNRQRDAKLFFELDTNAQYQLRINYFKEKVAQFKAMTPGQDYFFEFQFEDMGYTNSYRPSSDVPERQLRRIVKLYNGEAYLLRESLKLDLPGQTVFYRYNANTIFIPIRSIGDIPLSDRIIGIQQRRMAIACLTKSTGHENHQNVKLSFDNRSVTLASMEILGLWNINLKYGPFYIDGQPAFFRLHQKKIYLLFNNAVYPEETMCIRQGNTISSLLDLPIEDREFIFREGCYEHRIDRHQLHPVGNCGVLFLPYNHNITIKTFDSNRLLIIDTDIAYVRTNTSLYYVNISRAECNLICNDKRGLAIFDREIQPSGELRGLSKIELDRIHEITGHRHPISDTSCFSIENNKLIIERDFLCCKVNGISIYKRYINQNVTCIEIDYWREKDPVLSRFLTLMIAIFVKDSSKEVSFLARNSQFCHFLFNIAFDAANQVFKRAARTVSTKKSELALTLQNYERHPHLQQYSFFNNTPERLSWPSGYSGVSHVEDGRLIENGLSVLRP